MDLELITIGKISGTHGVRGTVKVIPLTDFPERFKNLEQVKVLKGSVCKDFNIISVQNHQQVLLIKFKELDTKEEAQIYNNALIQIPEDEIYDLPEGYFYHFQLIGLAVVDEERGNIGTIIDIIETGANDVYVIKSDIYGEILIPAIKEVILDINIDDKVMKVKLLKGLID